MTGDSSFMEPWETAEEEDMEDLVEPAVTPELESRIGEVELWHHEGIRQLIEHHPEFGNKVKDAYLAIATARQALKGGEDSGIRNMGAAALMMIAEELADAIPALLEALKEENNSVLIKYHAAMALKPLIAENAEAISAVIPILASVIEDAESKNMQVEAAKMLRVLGPLAETAAPALIRAFYRANDNQVTPQDRVLRDLMGSVLRRLRGDQFVADLYKTVNINKIEQGQGGPVPEIDEDTRSQQGDGYAELIRAARSRAHAVRQEIAAGLAPALNAHIRQMPHDTYEQKKELARWVTEQLEPLGLAVQDPKTKLPGKLRAKTGNWPGVGSFAIEIYIDGKQRITTTSDKLPELALTDATPPPEAEKLWQKAVGPMESRAARRR